MRGATPCISETLKVLTHSAIPVIVRRSAEPGDPQGFICRVVKCWAMSASGGRRVSGPIAHKAAMARRRHKAKYLPGQEVWPSKTPGLGIFFSCCGVIFAKS